MPNRSSKRQETDPNRRAFLTVLQATGGTAPPAELAATFAANGTGGKNPAAVALGHLGGIKGGPARAAALTAGKRKAIAKRAARARWRKRPKP